MLPKICTFPECPKDHYLSGLCGTHYRAAKPPCTFEGCAKPIHAKGYCGQHYLRVQRYGDVNATAFIKGDDVARFAQYVNKTKTCWNWTGGTDRLGYGKFKLNRKEEAAHRVSYGWEIGPIPDGMEIDHRCHNRSCVNPGHLRAVTRKQNMENLSGPYRSNTSGVRGVSWSKQHSMWRATVRHNGKNHHVGLFRDLAEAAESVLAKRNELFTHNLLDRLSA